MITGAITVELAGHPAPKGSMKCVGRRGKVKHVVVEDAPPTQAKWRAAIVEVFSRGVTQRADPYQPVGVEVTFTLARPAVHYGTGRNQHRLRDGAPTFPTRQNTNDTDKMARLVGDALQQSGLLVDDAQIVSWLVRKAYPDCPFTPHALPHPGAWIHVYPITAGA